MKPKSKREVPLVLLQALNKFIKRDKGNFPQIIPSDTYLLIKDPDPESDFVYEIKDMFISNGHMMFRVLTMPTNTSLPGKMENDIAADQLNSHFDIWASLVKAYNENDAYGDSVLREYEEEEYINFEELGEDAYRKSYSLPIQLFIDSYLEDVIKRLESFKGDSNLTPERLEEVEEIIETASDLKETQTQKTQSEVARVLSKLWAKAHKAGLDVFVEVRREAFKEGIKYFVKHSIESHDAIWGMIKGFLE